MVWQGSRGPCGSREPAQNVRLTFLVLLLHRGKLLNNLITGCALTGMGIEEKREGKVQELVKVGGAVSVCVQEVDPLDVTKPRFRLAACFEKYGRVDCLL